MPMRKWAQRDEVTCSNSGERDLNCIQLADLNCLTYVLKFGAMKSYGYLFLNSMKLEDFRIFLTPNLN